MDSINVYFLGFVLVALIAEIIWSTTKKKAVFNLKESLGNFGILVGNNLLKPLSLAWKYLVFDWVASFRLFEIPTGVFTIALTFLVTEFAYYWYHRLSHEVPALWTLHHTHHSSIWMNLTTAVRLNWLGNFISPLFYIPLVLIGFSPEIIVSSLAVSLFFQFFLHTEAVGKLGFLEGVFFNTPSAHRVHHGSNEKYIDKNYGGMLILFDRMFGTYQREEEKVKYGVTTGFLSHNPIVINFSPLLQFLKGSWKREKQRVTEQGVNKSNWKIMMKHTISKNNVLKAIAICFILIWTSSLAVGQCTVSSSAFQPEGLPEGFDSTSLTIESIQLPFPTLIEVADSNEVYVFGGQPVALDIFVNAILTGQPSQPNPLYYSQFTPYVVQVDPVTMDTMFLELSGGPGISYLGGIAKHPNGYLYAIARARLFKIDPANMSILTTINMPVQAGQPIIYNGVFITNSGLLVTKSTDLANPGQGEFFMLDPDSLQILNQIALDAGTARLALDCDSLGNEYIYHINREYTFRMLVVNDSLVVDTSWQAAYDPYGTGVNAEPTSPRLLNDIVAYTTNTSFDATEPMKIFWQRTGQSYTRDADTLRGEFMFSDTLSAGFDFFGLIMNEETEVILGQDQANGKLAAYWINNTDELTYLWEKEYAVCAASYIVGSTGMVYTNHYDAVEETTYLIILDLFTGNELGSVQTPATRPSISQTRVGAYNDFYYCSNEPGQSLGYFHRVSLGESATSIQSLTQINDLTVAPNPFENQTLVTWNNSGNMIFQVQLLNVAGQTLRTYQNVTGGSLLIEKEELRSGIYFLKIEDDAGNVGTLKLSLLN